MRVLVISTYFPNAAERLRAVFVHHLVSAMQRRCQVQVIAPVPYIPPLPPLPPSPAWLLALLQRPHWRAQRAIPAQENIGGIDVDHPRFLVVPKLGCCSGVSYFLGILRLLRRRAKEGGGGAVIVQVHCAYPDAVGVALAATLLGVPYVITAHGSDINVYAQRRTLRFQMRWALRHAAGVIAVSGALQAKIERLIDPGSGSSSVSSPGSSPGRAAVACIPCAAFDPQVFFPASRGAARAALGVGAQARLVVFVGQLVPIKGIGFLIEAWAELARRGQLGASDRLVIVGDGPCCCALERQALGAGLAGCVQFVAALSQTGVARWMAAASLLCLPSLDEGTPNVIVEALASGVPVVASGVGGIPDLICDGRNGFLVAPANSLALADAFERGFAQHWDALAIAASVAALTWPAIAERNGAFLQSILDDTHASVD